MEKLARLLKLLTRLVVFYEIALLVMLGWPTTGFLGVLVGIGVAGKRGVKYLTTLGSARWATKRELKRAGMLGAKSGLIIGRLEKNGELVRLPNVVHTAVFAPTGVGKGVSIAVPLLVTCDESVACIDFKGELFKLTAEARRKMGHRVVRLDPFGVCGPTDDSDTLNVLDFIKRTDRLAIDECNSLAKALVVRAEDEKEPHWSDSAEMHIAAIAASVVAYGDQGQGTRSLETVRGIISDPGRLEMAKKLMMEADDWDGMLKPLGGQLSYFQDREKSSALTSTSRHLRFLSTPAIAACTRTSSFDPGDLNKGKMTVYLILPPEHMRAQAGLLRMWITALMRAVIRGGLREKNKVHFLLDEAASLGHLECIDDAVDKYRGYGIRLIFLFQSMAQKEICFPKGQHQTLLSNTTQIFFGVNDGGLGNGKGTADYVSQRLGQATVITTSGGTSRGSNSSQSYGQHYGRSQGSNDGTNSGWREEKRSLLNPDEVIALDPRLAITLTPGLRPVMTRLIRYYEENLNPSWFKRQGIGARKFAVAAVMLAIAVAISVPLTKTLKPRPVRYGPGMQRVHY